MRQNNLNIMHTNNECIENPMKDNIEAVVEIFGPEGKLRLCTEIPIRLEIAIIAVVLYGVCSITTQIVVCNILISILWTFRIIY